ncbi:M56 family metallopeptidase [Niabella ginsengisoli]|uniref:TonB-dependent receptor plug domain-containing protein n=1 Tax=Niabella ginsengisoli TaxID=522298 RepID=A0ABS9SG97_9BACT|nr:M56 family metallopeptidase [Niabella ginsengisoli]MCH5597380.1 TonB-dependent receptor plug domain-containing protein [Niabella ginsengisoli]
MSRGGISFLPTFLRRLTFYNWNRWYLLGYTALSFIIPLIDIMPSLEKRALQENAMMQWIPAINFVLPQKQNFFEALSYWDWAISVLLLGSLVLLVRFMIRYYSFKRMKAKAELISNDTTKIYQLNEPIAPFSFGNAIFINTEMHSGEDLEEIIRHEFVHVKQKHTIDIMWCELLCVLNWFNPIVWLLRHSVKQNLEFIADSKVLQNGLDRKEYQYLLLKVMGNRQFAFTNHFNFSSLKKRIVMMNTIKSAKIHLIKFMFLLPVVAVLLLSFRKEVIKNNISEKENTTQKETIVKRDGQKESQVSRKDTVPKVTLKTAISTGNPDVKPLIVVDGETKEDGFDINTINSANIQSVDVLKGTSATSIYGDKGSNGVVKITTKQHASKRPAIMAKSFKIGENPLYLVDGQPMEREQFENINPNDIESITVLKDSSAKAVYGPKGDMAL